jgi:hypothetical protein
VVEKSNLVSTDRAIYEPSSLQVHHEGTVASVRSIISPHRFSFRDQLTAIFRYECFNLKGH